MNLRKDHYRFSKSWYFAIQNSREFSFEGNSGAAGLSAGGRTLLRTVSSELICSTRFVFAGGPWLWVRCTVDRTMVTNPLKDLRPCLGFFVALPPREELSTFLFFVKQANFGQLLLYEQYYTVDHLARGSMKNAANCVSECELQDI